MEKAKLIVRLTKKKEIFAKLQFRDGKEMSASQLKLKDTVLDGADVEVERQKGQVVQIKLADKVLFSAHTSKRTDSSITKPEPMTPKKTDDRPKPSVERSHAPAKPELDRLDEHVSREGKPAYSPYNFIPLNKEVVEASQVVPLLNKYDGERNTGWIDVEIEAITPLYIRGTLTKAEVEGQLDSKDKPGFCAPVERIRIPGSSLRGMTRNMVEIVSFGKFSFFEDRRLYYRELADQGNLRHEYQSRMSSFDSKSKSTIYKMVAGYLVKNGPRYEIIPARIQEGKQFVRIRKDKTNQLMSSNLSEFNNYKFFNHNGNFIVISGYMPNKNDWLIYPPDENAQVIWIDDNDVRNYCSDQNRNAVNLIEELNKNRTLKLPCFYIRWMDDKKERISFGHTAMFRLAYEKTIGEHVPQPLKNEDKTDFAEAIFGNEKTHAGRVFFEDAFLIDEQDDPQLDPQTPQILSTPKPTTFQHYLVQSEVKQLNHYNSNAALRGYKFYWHKSGEQWFETDARKIENQKKQHLEKGIRPVKSGTRFRGRIRFENLSDEELGALLFTLDLPGGCGHKLGMGKPLGLGSIRITPKLYVSNRTERYRNFFAEWDNGIAVSDKLSEKKRAFEKYILQKIGEDREKLLWETDRLRELLVMLRYDVGRELERKGENRYMSIEPPNEFKKRCVLPRPTALLPPADVDSFIANLKGQAAVEKKG